jgi:hypothetical protein
MNTAEIKTKLQAQGIAVLTIDQAVALAFQARDGKDIEDQDQVRDVLLTEIERLEETDTFEARFTYPILQGLADDLYRPDLGNASVGP